MATKKGEVYINKLAAAQRQICASIRFYFQDEDELAIHTVAAASYVIISDLKAARDKDEPEDRWTTGFFYLVRDYKRGVLDEVIKKVPEFGNPAYLKIIKEIAEKSTITGTSNFYEDLDFKIEIPPKEKAKFFRSVRKASNFLKHAEFDPDKFLSLEAINNLQYLLVVSVSYMELTNEMPGPEGLVVMVYESVQTDEIEFMDNKDLRDCAVKLSGIDEKEQKKFCSKWIEASNWSISQEKERPEKFTVFFTVLACFKYLFENWDELDF